MEKYSVLMSVYYKENPIWLKESIESMLNQTVKCDEFVIVKDGKLTNELNNIINGYVKKYRDLFKVIELKENKGLGIALKIGLENCKNEFVARMDADDYSVPERCEKELEMFEKNSDLHIIGSNIAEFTENIENVISYRRLPVNDKEIKKFSKTRNPFGHPSVMFKKSKVMEAGNYRNYYLCEDYDMWIRMIKCNANCYNFKEILVYMRISKDFYKRRGGIKYLKTILKFKKEQYKSGFYSLKDYIISSSASTVICLMPNVIRDFIYRKLLRSNPK